MNVRAATLTTFLAAFRTIAALVALVAQVGIAGAAVADAQKGASAASHLESGGTNLHFAHNEADCCMCRAQHLGDAAPFNAAPPAQQVEIDRSVQAVDVPLAWIARAGSNTTRAPPSIV